MLGLSVAGSTINRVGNHFGETWSCDDDTGSGSVADLCNALAPLMPPLFDDRSDIAAELLRAHHQVVALLAGPLAEEIFTGERLPGSAHDETEGTEIGALVCRSASSLPAYLGFARAEARALLLDHAAAVIALIEHRTLDGREIDLIIRKTLKC